MDTHIHTCLSPCAELDMHPAAVVRAAVQAGLDAIAICDHNSAENVSAGVRAGKMQGVSVIPGMEITTEEEVHVLGLLPDAEHAFALQSKIYKRLPGKNDENVFGMQVIANERAEVVGFNEHLLAGASTLTLDEVVDAIHRAEGLAVASHVDRERFGLVGQLGFVPPGLALDGIEVSRHMPLMRARALFSPRDEFAILCASDAHEPKDIGTAATFVLMNAPTFSELRQALAGSGGRAVLGGGRLMEDLALHILDIAQNSVEAGATQLEIELIEDRSNDRLAIRVADNGKGMDPEVAAKATDPFFTTRTTRRVGMGLPLLAEAARNAGGSLEIESRPGEGSCVRATFQHSHIDRAPLGDIETTLMALIVSHPALEVCFRHQLDERVFELDSHALRLAGIDPGLPEGLRELRQVIRKGEAGLAETAGPRN